MRQTIQKTLIRDTVFALDHPTADDVYNDLHTRYPNVSRATVYRNLNSLAEDGILYKFPFPDSGDIFDKTTGRHFHIRCQRCGRIADLPEDVLPELPQEGRTGSFTITGFELNFYGICDQCNQ